MMHMDKGKKICFVAPKAYALFHPQAEEVIGGAEVDLYFLATELAKDNNFEVSFIVADYGQDEIETIEDVQVLKSFSFKENPLIGAVKIWKALKQVNTDMYLVKSISMGVFLVALFCRMKKKVFLYRTAHTTHCDGRYLKKNPLRGRLFKRALKTAALVFVQNDSDRKALQLTTSVDSIVIPNGHRLGELSKNERSGILWVGRSAAFKRPQLFLDLAKKFPNEKFVFICQQATEDNNYHQLVTRVRQVKNIEFIERVPFAEIETYFQQAKVFVNTSDAEGFPNTFIQACKCATPILSLNVNPDGFLDQYNCGVCCNDDWELFHRSLAELLENEHYKALGSNARKYAEEKHDITRIAPLYKKLFTELARPETSKAKC